MCPPFGRRTISDDDEDYDAPPPVAVDLEPLLTAISRPPSPVSIKRVAAAAARRKRTHLPRARVEPPPQFVTCAMCYDNYVDIILVPCGHLTTCLRCASEWAKKHRGQRMPCPVCKKPVARAVKFFDAGVDVD